MKTICFFFLFLSGTMLAHAQGLTGRLTDDKGTVVSHANVTLFRLPDTAWTTATLTDTTGRFSLAAPAPGRYFLQFSSIGFRGSATPEFTVDGTGFARDFGTIALKTDAQTLKTVSVRSLRPTIVQKADRLVVSVEGTALASSSTAFDVLARAPGVFIDQDGNIQLNGRSGVTVMLDGKLTYLSARELRTLLEGMSAENIRNIEIITNPSARFDAEGSSGILNINLKKNDRRGINGSTYAGWVYNGKQHAYNAGGNVNWKIGRWNSFLNLDFARRAGGREATFTRVFYGDQKTTYFDQVATGNFYVSGPPALRLGSDYSFNTRHSLGFMVNYGTNSLENDFLTSTYLGPEAKRPSEFIQADNYGTNTFTSFTSNLHYGGKFDTLGSGLTADVDYARITNRGEAYFYNFFTDLTGADPVRQDFLYTDVPNGFDIYSFKTDYTKAGPNGRKWETGVKASHVLSDNDARFYFNNGPQRELDPRRTNHFNYRENILAAYINYSGTLSKRISVQAGLRAEHTGSLGRMLTTGQTTERNYLSLFPSVFIQQKVSENYGVNYSYSRRIQRPYYGNLNPFLFYRDPYTWFQGNPYLRPQFAHAISITQTFRKTYNLVFNYQLTKDVIAELPLLDADSATTVYYTGNVNDGHNVGLTAMAPVRLTKWWDTQNTMVLSYTKFSMQDSKGELVNDQVFYMVQSNHTIQLPWDLRAELNLLYRGPSVSGLYQIAPWFRADAGLKKSLVKKKLDLSLTANDLFKGQRFRFATDINGNINDFDQYFRVRNIGLTLRYHFSKGSKTETRKANSLEEVNRTGG
ncbi:MAG TPA: outer membrane beta-barrel protein [Chitinophagaceae bacterium]|nr:outer membrane beta-barrel protein [Chitinophagaceae bacterium]